MKVKVESGKSWLKTQHLENEDHVIWFYHFVANKWGTMETVTDFIFVGVQKSLQMVTEAMKLKGSEEKL